MNFYVAFGGNLGDPCRTFREVGEQLASHPGVADLRLSPLYRTAPAGGPIEQPAFRNGCLEIRTSLEPTALFDLLAETENRFGRRREQTWAARTIDLDLVLTDGEPIAAERLIVPHPRMHYRWFVLRPLVDLNPKAWHGVLKRTAAQLLQLVEAEDSAALVVGDEAASARVRVEFVRGFSRRRVIGCPADSRCLKMNLGSLDRPSYQGECMRSILHRHQLDPLRTWLLLAADSVPAFEINESMERLPLVDCRQFGVEHFAQSLQKGVRDGAADS